jgi:hypothetical protein
MTNREFAVPPRDRRLPPPPPIGPDRAQQMGFTREEYDQAKGWYVLVWRRHLDAALPGAPGQLHGNDLVTFLKSSTSRAEDVLADGARDVLDPCLESANDDLVEAAGTATELERWPRKEIEADGAVCAIADARRTADQLTAEIQRDTDEGYVHHRRTSPVWRHLSSVLMILDLIAIIVIFCDILNVDYQHPLSSPPEFLAAVLLPVVLVAVQLWLATSTGRRFNDHRQLDALGNAAADEAARKARLWSVLTALFVLPLTALLLVRLYSMSAEAELGRLWQIVLVGLALAIGLGAPLVKVRVVAEDGSSSSRRRDELEEALAAERAAADMAVRTGYACLDEVRRSLDDYVSRLRPEVVHEASGSLVQAENALGLVTVLIGSKAADAAGIGLVRSDPAARPGAADFATIAWPFEGAPEIDNGPLLIRDRTYLEQVAREQLLRTQLERLAGASREAWVDGPAAVVDGTTEQPD